MNRYRRLPAYSGMGSVRLPENVIPFRMKRASYVFYLNDEDTQVETLEGCFQRHQICNIHSEEELRGALAVATPCLILVKEVLNWAATLPLIKELSLRTEAPIILLLKKKKSKGQTKLIKAAYKAGIYDLLYLPLNREEVLETVEVLLKAVPLQNR